jgi:Domain of unknown function (DUF4169)
MADIVNLRRARKAKARAEDAKLAEQNRITFGRTKDEKKRTAATKALAEKTWDGHKRGDT